MEHKKKKITMGFALLVCAMVALVGVGYALAYQGSADTNIDDATGELVTVGIAKTGFDNGAIYTVNTFNHGSYVNVDALKKGNESATLYDDGHFTYSDGFTWVTGAPADAPASGVYYASEAGQITLTLTQTAGATANVCSMTASSSASMPTPTANGISLVFTYKIGNADEVVFTPANNTAIPGIDLSHGAVTVLVTAYVVYHSYVDSGNIAQIVPFALPESTLTFTVSASTS